jgi:ABC-type transporter Mla subunit MlaD
MVMEGKSTDVKVGITVILAAIILILGILWIGEFRLSRKWASYVVYFDEVGGLSSGAIDRRGGGLKRRLLR